MAGVPSSAWGLRAVVGNWVVTIEAHAPMGNELIMAEDCARSPGDKVGYEDRTLLYVRTSNFEFRRTGTGTVLLCVLFSCFRASLVKKADSLLRKVDKACEELRRGRGREVRRRGD